MNPRKLVFSLAVLAGAVARLGADVMWLEPERFTATPGATLQFDLTSAAGFTGRETAIKAENLARAVFLLGGESSVLTPAGEGRHALELLATLGRPGVVVAGVELKPQVIEREPEKIERYFREIHAGAGLRAEWTALREPRRWRERNTQVTKAFMRVGQPAADDRAWAVPSGAPLEILPERDPMALQAGDELPVRVLKKGAPLAGFAVEYLSNGETREHVVFTDADGRASARLGVAGLWLVRGTDLRRATNGELEWESDTVTMLVDIR